MPPSLYFRGRELCLIFRRLDTASLIYLKIAERSPGRWKGKACALRTWNIEVGVQTDIEPHHQIYKPVKEQSTSSHSEEAFEGIILGTGAGGRKQCLDRDWRRCVWEWRGVTRGNISQGMFKAQIFQPYEPCQDWTKNNHVLDRSADFSFSPQVVRIPRSRIWLIMTDGWISRSKALCSGKRRFKVEFERGDMCQSHF